MVQNISGIRYGKVLLGIAILLMLKLEVIDRKINVDLSRLVRNEDAVTFKPGWRGFP